MAKLSDAVREALMAAKGLDGIDIEAICPGITSASCLSSIANTLSIQMLRASKHFGSALAIIDRGLLTLGGF